MNPEWRGKGYSWKGSLGPQGPGDPHCQSQTPHGRRKWTMRFWVPDAAGQGWSRHVRQVYRQTEGNEGAAAAGGREHGGPGGEAPACRWPPRRRTGLGRGSEGRGDGSDEPDPCNARELGTARAATRESTSPRSTGGEGGRGQGRGQGRTDAWKEAQKDGATAFPPCYSSQDPEFPLRGRASLCSLWASFLLLAP